MNSISTITPTLGNCVVKLDTEERIMALDSGITLFGTVVRMGDNWPEYEQKFGEGDRVKLMHSNDQKFEEEDGTYIVTPFSNIQGFWKQ